MSDRWFLMFWRRAEAWFNTWGVTCERVLTDNGACYRSRAWHQACAQTATTPKHTRPYRPQRDVSEFDGKIERFHRTLLEEWSYVRPWSGETRRASAYRGFLHYHNHHRAHGALGWRTPAAIIGDNLPGCRT